VSGDQLTAALLPILAPLAVLSLPFLDMLLAMLRRTRAGQRPWEPDSQASAPPDAEPSATATAPRSSSSICGLPSSALGTVSMAFYRGWLVSRDRRRRRSGCGVHGIPAPKWFPPKVHAKP
jgi:hypothetical protein